MYEKGQCVSNLFSDLCHARITYLYLEKSTPYLKCSDLGIKVTGFLQRHGIGQSWSAELAKYLQCGICGFLQRRRIGQVWSDYIGYCRHANPLASKLKVFLW